MRKRPRPPRQQRKTRLIRFLDEEDDRDTSSIDAGPTETIQPR